MGITKAEKAKKLEEYAINKGYFLEKGPGGGWRTFQGSDSPPPTSDTRFWRLKKDYEKAPAGLTWDGITEAVKKGLEGIGTTIADAIGSAIKDLIPDSLVTILGDLQKTITNLQTWMDNHNLGGVAAGVGNVAGTLPWVMVLGPAGAPMKYIWDATMEAYKPEESEKSGYASGVSFTRSGLFRGRVHASEEIIPQATAARGPGPIAQAIEALDSIMSGRPVAAGAGASYNIQVANHNDFSGMKVSGDVDIERLLAKIDKRIETKSIEAVRNAIGQRRT